MDIIKMISESIRKSFKIWNTVEEKLTTGIKKENKKEFQNLLRNRTGSIQSNGAHYCLINSGTGFLDERM